MAVAVSLLCAILLLLAAPAASARRFGKWQQKHYDNHGGREVIDLSQPLIWESTSKGTIDLNGKPVHIKGINWNGMELPRPMIAGLEDRRMRDLLDILEQHNFNALRIPLSYEAVKHMDEPFYGADRKYVDPELEGKTPFQVMDVFMQEAAQRGILVMFDLHLIDPMKGFDPLWYTEKVSEPEINGALSRVLGRYERFWNFFAIDIKNEPHGDASWGDSNPKTDFNKYAERSIVQLHQEHPNWKGLFVVEGVGDHADADYHAPYKIWWGSDVSGVVKHPINVGHPDVARRIVFSPRIYGPDVYEMEYFSDPAFPENLFDVWDAQFVWLERTTGRAAIMGEYGGSLEDNDRAVQQHLVKWMASRCIDDSFWWVFNPGSTDIPDGVMKADWYTLDQEKLDLIDYVQPTPTKIIYNKISLEINRGAPRNPECKDGPSQAIRPTPGPSAPPNSYRPDPFEGLPPGTTSQEVRRMRREQKQKGGGSGTGTGAQGGRGTGAQGGHPPHA